MIYRFTIISDEVDDFVREIQIDPEATFFDFHEAILKSVGYTNDQMTSFFICDDDWEKEKEITLEEMDDNPEMDSWVMKDTTISELVEDEKQKLLYVFDYMTERCFFIELSEIITGKEMTGAKCTKKSGDAPKQTIDFEEMAAASSSLDLDENFYGDQDFDMEDFDDGTAVGAGAACVFDDCPFEHPVRDDTSLAVALCPELQSRAGYDFPFESLARFLRRLFREDGILAVAVAKTGCE